MKKRYHNFTSCNFACQVLNDLFPNRWGCSVGGICVIHSSILSSIFKIFSTAGDCSHLKSNDFPSIDLFSANINPRYSYTIRKIY